MPAAAVIPAPVAYIKVVAVKKLVVRIRVRGRSRGPGASAPSSIVDFGRPFAFPALSAGVDRCKTAVVRARVPSSRGVRRASVPRRVAPSAISPPRVLLTECPRRPVRSL